MTAQRLTVHGRELVADISGALYWPERETLVVSDLHLEKGSSGARSGHLLPPFDSRATLDRVGAAMRRTRPRRVICLGDSFHDGAGPARLDPRDAARIRALARTVDWVWIAGNHDPAPPEALGGRAAAELAIGGLVFRHQACPTRRRERYRAISTPGRSYPCAAGACAVAASRPTRRASCCRRWAPTPAGSTCSIRPSPASWRGRSTSC